MSSFRALAASAFLFAGAFAQAASVPAADVENAVAPGTAVYLDLQSTFSRSGLTLDWTNFSSVAVSGWNFPDGSDSGILVDGLNPGSASGTGQAADDKDHPGGNIAIRVSGLAPGATRGLYVVAVGRTDGTTEDFSYGADAGSMTIFENIDAQPGARTIRSGTAGTYAVYVGTVTADAAGGAAFLLGSGSGAGTGSNTDRTQIDGIVIAPVPVVRRPPIVPRWAFEPWVWEDNVNTRAAVEGLVAGYTSRDIPVGAVIIDSPWQTFHNTLVWDETRYPEPQAMIDGFHAQGIRVVNWMTGFVNTNSPDYDFVKAQGYAVDGGADFVWWRGVGLHLDFTKPAAMAWWHAKTDAILTMGIDGWKVDVGADRLNDTVSTSIGTITRQAFKKYYYDDFHDSATAVNPDAITVARGFSTLQGGPGASFDKISVVWNGDFKGDFSGLVAQKDDAYESALRGFAAPGIEVGGYHLINPTKKSLLRYAQFGALMPLMENGGTNGGLAEHLPWYWDAETVAIYRYFATLHSELTPYLFHYSVEANATGESIVRAPSKTKSHHRLGADLFVSPIVSDTTSKTVDLPAGDQWIDWWDETAVHPGGTQLAVGAPLARMPLFIRAGAILPMNVRNDATGHGDATSAGKTTLVLYPRGSSATTLHLPTGDGIGFSDAAVSVDETAGSVQIGGVMSRPYRLRVKCFATPASVTGADAWSYDAAGDWLTIDKSGANVSLAIDGLAGYATAEAAKMFQDWLAAAGLAGANASDDPLARGVPLGVQYALGLDPAAIDRSRLPRAAMSGGDPALAFERPATPPPGVTYVVEVSTDLAQWHSGESWTWPAATLNNGDGTETVTVRLKLPEDQDGRAFMRLRVSIPAIE